MPTTRCPVARRNAHVACLTRPERQGWQGLEVDRVRREFEEILAARPTDGVPFSPDPDRQACVTSLLARSPC